MLSHLADDCGQAARHEGGVNRTVIIPSLDCTEFGYQLEEEKRRILHQLQPLSLESLSRSQAFMPLNALL